MWLALSASPSQVCVYHSSASCLLIHLCVSVSNHFVWLSLTSMVRPTHIFTYTTRERPRYHLLVHLLICWTIMRLHPLTFSHSLTLVGAFSQPQVERYSQTGWLSRQLGYFCTLKRSRGPPMCPINVLCTRPLSPRSPAIVASRLMGP